MKNHQPMRGLLTSSELRNLSTKSNVKGFIQLTSHMTAIGLSAALMSLLINTYWFYLAAFIHGFFLNYLYAGQHELSHGTVFTNKRINDLFCSIFGFLTFNPSKHDLIHHMRHHRYTNNWSKDSELQVRNTYTIGTYLYELSGIGFWVGRLKDIFTSSKGKIIGYQVSEENQKIIVWEARSYLFSYLSILIVSIFSGSWFIMIYWIGPLIFTKWTHNLHNLIEHNGMAHTSNVLENTRSIDAPRWWRWIGWNMQYHTIHHAFPMIPFHNLPKAHELIVNRLGCKPATMGYFEFQIAMIKKLLEKPESKWKDDEIIIKSS